MTDRSVPLHPRSLDHSPRANDPEESGLFAALAGRTALVTGSSGFVGSRVFERLVSMGCRVQGVGRRPLDIPGYIRLDLAMPVPAGALPPADIVVHAAARASPWGSRRDFERQNVLATRHVINHCLQTGSPRLVFISSSSVYYQNGDQHGVTEDTPLPRRAVNRYAETKRRAEDLVREYPGEWVILRPRAVFGPGDPVLMPRLLAAARAGRLPRLARPGPPVVGDLIYIDNLVDYTIRAAADPRVFGCYNVTNNEPVEIQAFVLDVLGQLGIPPPQRDVPLRVAMAVAGMVELAYAWFAPGREPPITRFGVHVFAYSKTFDVTRAIEAMGPPRVSVAEGLAQTVAWARGEEQCQPSST